MGRTINFIDLFDWSLESDRHLMSLMNGPYFEEEMLAFKEEAEIVVQHLKTEEDGNNNAEADEGTLRGTPQEGV